MRSPIIPESNMENKGILAEFERILLLSLKGLFFSYQPKETIRQKLSTDFENPTSNI